MAQVFLLSLSSVRCQGFLTMSPAIPKVAIPPERWTATVYDTPAQSLAKADVAKLGAMQFDPHFYSRAYLQCIGRGTAHKECVASLPDDVRITPAGPLAQENKALSDAIACMGQHGVPEKCSSHFDDLAKLAGYQEEVKKGSVEKATDFCGKAGYKLLGVPVLYYAMKFIKIK